MKTLHRIRQSYWQIYFLLCAFMVLVANQVQAGWLDSGKKLATDAAEPIGIVVMMIGGMKISQKDLYAGIAAVVGGIFIFKAPDIVAGLK
ncbi:MAG: hypothetical protein PHV34_14730 [Verrucomicrobiae bacterium]|nr:hypothetical protein [Verrucomicrobiae bacterium]